MSRTKLKDGCPGCDQLWRAQYAEGQCTRCKRCLSCCGKEKVRFSCAAKDAHLAAIDPSNTLLHRSAAAYNRWLNHPNVLGHNRRIT